MIKNTILTIESLYTFISNTIGFDSECYTASLSAPDGHKND